MNAKVESSGIGKTLDLGLLTLAVLVVVGGLAAYYLLPPTVAPIWRTLSVVGGIVFGCGVAWATLPGRNLRGFLRETQFEMRKVVWPTREETLRTTLVVVVIVAVLCVLLGVIDVLLRWAILDHLLKL